MYGHVRDIVCILGNLKTICMLFEVCPYPTLLGGYEVKSDCSELFVKY